jgi:integrase/recombinase XerD
MELTEFKQYLTAKGYSTETVKTLLKGIVKFTDWLQLQNIELSNINYNDITAYIKQGQERGIKTRTVQLIANYIKHYLNYLVDAGILSYNPALALKLKNVKRKTVYNILSPEELETIYKSYTTEIKKHLIAPPQGLNELSRKRNKVLLGLFVYQGITTEEAKILELTHLDLREGNITIPGTRRSNERTLKLESHQVFNLYDYVNDIRKQILQLTKKQSQLLFISTGASHQLQNALQKLIHELTSKNSNIENLHQIRASVITNWLKQYNKRKVQYMAGHRYISSTEAYEANNIDVLQEDVEKFYPVL